jgi:hypothetical protein
LDKGYAIMDATSPRRDTSDILAELREDLRQRYGLDALSVTVDWRKPGERSFRAPLLPVADTKPKDTSCSTDILVVVTEEAHRLSAMQLLGELESRDLIHGESTVKMTLARLVASGELDNPKRNGRNVGYGLPGWE